MGPPEPTLKSACEPPAGWAEVGALDAVVLL